MAYIRFKLAILTFKALHILWSSVISLWPLATSRTHEVSTLIQFSSAFSPPAQLNIRISCFLVFRSRSLKLFTYQYPWISVTFYFQMSSKDFLLSVSLPPFSWPLCLEYLCPRAQILVRHWRYYKSFTYLTIHEGKHLICTLWESVYWASIMPYDIPRYNADTCNAAILFRYRYSAHP